MAFKTRQIRKKARVRPLKRVKSVLVYIFSKLVNLSKKQRSYIWGAVLILISMYVVSTTMIAAYNFIKGFDPKSIVLAIGADLKKDENGYTNILLLGDGGHVRDGADLIDTIMVASIDYDKRAVSLLSIPRDYYVKSDSAIWDGKINELYRNHKNQLSEEERYELFKTIAGEIVNLDIQYYMRINFNAFVELVDSLDGISVDVKEPIYDPYYPNETDNGYVLFEVEKGLQKMDGETALKFVRSRKTTSDFDRAARQQLVIAALREKALSKKILTSSKSLKKIYNAMSKNMNTDMTLREMVSFAGFGQYLNRNRVVMKVLHDDPGQDGGFLYTPERKFYNNLFVLVPFGNNLDLIHKYADLIFHKREALWEKPTIEVLNATEIPGIARNALYQLNRFGFNVVSMDNYTDYDGNKKIIDESIIYYYDWEEDKDGVVVAKYQDTLNALDKFVRANPLPGNSLESFRNVDISIVLGKDYEVYNVK